MKILRVEFRDVRSTEQACYTLRYGSSVVCDEVTDVCAACFLDIKFDNGDVKKSVKHVTEVSKLLGKSLNWSIVGPICYGVGAADAHAGLPMEAIERPRRDGGGPAWRCLHSGCGNLLDRRDLPYMSFGDFGNFAGMMRDAEALLDNPPAVIAIDTETNKGTTPETLIKEWRRAAKQVDFTWSHEYQAKPMPLIDDRPNPFEGCKVDLGNGPKTIRSYGTTAKNFMIQACHDEYEKDLAARIKRLEHDFDETRKRNSEFVKKIEELQKDKSENIIKRIRLHFLEQRFKEAEGVIGISDEMFQFMAGLNMQDHPVSDQRKFLDVLAKLKKALYTYKNGGNRDELSIANDQQQRTRE